MGRSIDKREDKPKEKVDLDGLMENMDLNEKTELEGVAEQVFRGGDERTNIHNLELGLIMSCDVHFSTLGISDSNPTNNFKNLAKSRMGWSMNKFVESVGGVQNQRSGGTMGSWFKDRLIGGGQPK